MSINLFDMVLADAGGTKAIQKTPTLPPPVQTTKTVATTPVTAPKTTSTMTGTSTASLPPSVQRQIAAAQPVAKAPAVSGAVQETQQMQTRLINETIQKPAVVQGMTGGSTASLPASVQQAIAQTEQQRRDAERDAADRALMQAMSATATPPPATFNFFEESKKDPSKILLQASRDGKDTYWFNGVQYNTRQQAEEAQKNAKIVGMGDMRLPAQMTEEEFLDSVRGPQPVIQAVDDRPDSFMSAGLDGSQVVAQPPIKTSTDRIQAIDDAPGSLMSDGLRTRLEGSDVGIDERQPDVIETPTVKTTTVEEITPEEITDVAVEEVSEEITPTEITTTEPSVEERASQIVNNLANDFSTFAFTWDQQAMDEALAQYDVDVAQAVRNAIEARNQLAVQRAEALNAFYGGQYSSASKIEKFGWTGGAATDEKMRMAYLNATINSNMFNQKEMVLAGYDSELAIAREFAKVNLTKLANEKYERAQANAIGLAEVTGRYMSPEARDILSNYNIALNNPNDPRNAGVIASVNQWIAAQGITPEEFQQMNQYFNRYILYGNTLSAMQWDTAVERAEMKDVFRTFNGYGYSKEEWDNMVTTLEASGLKWNESTQNFTRDGQVVTIDKDEDEEPGSFTPKEADDTFVANNIDSINALPRRTLQSIWTTSEFRALLAANPNSFTPIYAATGSGVSSGNIVAYNLPSGFPTNKNIKSITAQQYNWLMQNWWSK